MQRVAPRPPCLAGYGNTFKYIVEKAVKNFHRVVGDTSVRTCLRTESTVVKTTRHIGQHRNVKLTIVNVRGVRLLSNFLSLLHNVCWCVVLCLLCCIYAFCIVDLVGALGVVDIGALPTVN